MCAVHRLDCSQLFWCCFKESIKHISLIRIIPPTASRKGKTQLGSLQHGLLHCTHYRDSAAEDVLCLGCQECEVCVCGGEVVLCCASLLWHMLDCTCLCEYSVCTVFTTVCVAVRRIVLFMRALTV